MKEEGQAGPLHLPLAGRPKVALAIFGRGEALDASDAPATGVATPARNRVADHRTHASDSRQGGGEGAPGCARAAVVALARAWIGTPYVHQASAKGQGTDCLGLIRGVYRELHGADPEAPPPYTPDWNERRSAEEPLLSAARRHLRELKIHRAGATQSGASGVHLPRRAAARAGHSGEGPRVRDFVAPRGDGSGIWGDESIKPAQILIFRIVTDGPAKHCGIAAGDDRFIHAYAGRAVIEGWLSRWWMERIAGVFEFPGVEE